MRYFFILLRQELRTLLFSPATYTVAVLFLGLMGCIYWRILLQLSLEPQRDLPSRVFFEFFWLPVFFVVPLLTMKSVAEERRLGTLETLKTTPVTALQIVLSKFSAAYLLYNLLWLLTLAYPILVASALGSTLTKNQLLEPGVLIGGYLFIASSGLLFIAVGILCSSLTRSQFVAGMLSFCPLFVIIIGFRELQQEAGNWLPSISQTLNYFQPFRHLENFSGGVLDSRPLIFYLSNTFLVLGLSVLVVDAKSL